MADTATADPYVVIEQTRRGYTRYRNTLTGRRWEVRGTCDRRGDCLVGAVIQPPQGAPVLVRDKAHIAQLRTQLGTTRIDTELDVPITPEFSTCCGADRFTYVELTPGVEPPPPAE
jgi:hypothetical protein